MIPVAPLKSEESIVQVNPQNNNETEPSNTSTKTDSSSDPYERRGPEAKPDLKELPVVIPDDQKDSPNSSDSSKGSNETI